LLLGVIQARTVHSARKYALEDWRGLTAYLSSKTEDRPLLWLSELEAIVPLHYYGLAEFEQVQSAPPPACQTSCWWVLRQPYTTTHALAQGIDVPGRPWKPSPPPGCQFLDGWDSPTGVALRRVACKP
jgi:hypothetical protein